MLVLCSEIKIGRLSFEWANEVRIVHGGRSLTDTCTIQLPQNVRLKDSDLKAIVRQNDKVTVRLGYNGVLYTEFNGYVVRTEPGVPFKIHCEDDAWLLKQKPITKSFRSPTLAEIIAAMDLPIPYVVIDMKFGAFRLNAITAAMALEQLQQKFGIDSSIHEGTLYVGVSPPHGKEVKLNVQYNVVTSNLSYRFKSETAVKVVCLSLMPNNEIIEATAGQGGEEIRRVYYRIDQNQLQATADNLLSKYQYDGYRGDITTFGEPYLQYNDRVYLQDEAYPERAGLYDIESIDTVFGVNGFRRTIKIGAKHE
ncbi:MAG: hypothetical protein IT273_09200 [Chitinophagales bacterium]|nr:hypothetical protein [Chitinophagales bacterium]